MIPHFDYIVYNSITGVIVGDGVPSMLYPKGEASRDALKVFSAGFLSLIDYAVVNPRPPYEWSLQCINTKLRVSGRYSSPMAHVEVPGSACDILEKRGELDGIVRDMAQALVRLDVAVDFLSDVQPDDFAELCANKNFRSKVTFRSNTGHTEYVGSMHSDRFARVYRYHPPTPRHQYLRCEHVFKRKAARIAAEWFGVGGWKGLLSSIGDTWKWSHSLWVDAIPVKEGDARKIGWKRERKTSTTLRWLERCCAPSLVRLIRSGEIDNIEEWMKDNVYDKLTSKSD